MKSYMLLFVSCVLVCCRYILLVQEKRYVLGVARIHNQPQNIQLVVGATRERKAKMQTIGWQGSSSSDSKSTNAILGYIADLTLQRSNVNVHVLSFGVLQITFTISQKTKWNKQDLTFKLHLFYYYLLPFGSYFFFIRFSVLQMDFMHILNAVNLLSFRIVFSSKSFNPCIHLHLTHFSIFVLTSTTFVFSIISYSLSKFPTCRRLSIIPLKNSNRSIIT